MRDLWCRFHLNNPPYVARRGASCTINKWCIWPDVFFDVFLNICAISVNWGIYDVILYVLVVVLPLAVVLLLLAVVFPLVVDLLFLVVVLLFYCGAFCCCFAVGCGIRLDPNKVVDLPALTGVYATRHLPACIDTDCNCNIPFTCWSRRLSVPFGLTAGYANLHLHILIYTDCEPPCSTHPILHPTPWDVNFANLTPEPFSVHFIL